MKARRSDGHWRNSINNHGRTSRPGWPTLPRNQLFRKRISAQRGDRSRLQYLEQSARLSHAALVAEPCVSVECARGVAHGFRPIACRVGDVGKGHEGLRGAVFVAAAAETNSKALEKDFFRGLIVTAEIVEFPEVVEGLGDSAGVAELAFEPRSFVRMQRSPVSTGADSSARCRCC